MLTFHGTISDLSDMPAFLAKIRRGRPAPAELVHEVTRRYEAIGGSPLMKHTVEQAARLEERLGVPVHVAGRLWHPYPEEVLAEIVAGGARRVLSLPLAPQSVDVYHAAVREAAVRFPGLEITAAPPWGDEPSLIAAFLETIDEGLRRAPSPSVPVVLSAHSLPKRVIDAGDRYEIDFRHMAGLVAVELDKRGHPVAIAFQSQGASNEPWLGPDLATTFQGLAAAGHREVLVAPIGFVAEHVETLYDLDIEAPQTAAANGIVRFARAPAVGARPRFIDALEAVARRALSAPAAVADRG